nr:hypothetical protein BaRGS_024072 [Batillaria attramentaria]
MGTLTARDSDFTTEFIYHGQSTPFSVQTTIEEVAVELVATAAPRVRTAVPVITDGSSGCCRSSRPVPKPTTYHDLLADFHCFDKTSRKIRNEELWERAGQEPVAKQILRRKWGWIGHTPSGSQHLAPHAKP